MMRFETLQMPSGVVSEMIENAEGKGVNGEKEKAPGPLFNRWDVPFGSC